MMRRLLLIEDDESLREILAMNLEDHGFEVDLASTGEEALAHYDGEIHDVVLTDLQLPGMHGLEVLRRILAKKKDALVLVLTAYGGAENALEAMREGAFHYVEKPVNTMALVHEIERALDHGSTHQPQTPPSEGVAEMIASSPAMNSVLKVVDRVASSSAPVMILGESGVGKELVAHAIHDRSRRANKPFIAVNCAAIPADLLESILFGYEKGAFTGASQRKDGKFIAADGGTLFLDEIGEMPVQLQSKLLRVLQDGLVERVGSVDPRPVDVRILTATHQNLAEKIEKKEFREDLYYRLHVVPLKVPSLRERREDIPVLMRHFVREFTRESGEHVEISSDVDGLFLEYDWPGNVRELRNMVERMILLRESDVLGREDVPEELQQRAENGHKDRTGAWYFELPEGGLDFNAFEKELIIRVLAKFGGNQSAAARYLNVPRHVLLYRVEKFGIEVDK